MLAGEAKGRVREDESGSATRRIHTAVSAHQGDHLVRRACAPFPSRPPRRPAESRPGLNSTALPAGLGVGLAATGPGPPEKDAVTQEGRQEAPAPLCRQPPLRRQPPRLACSRPSAVPTPPAAPPRCPARARRVWPESRLATAGAKTARCSPMHRLPRSARETARVRPGSQEPFGPGRDRCDGWWLVAVLTEVGLPSWGHQGGGLHRAHGPQDRQTSGCQLPNFSGP